MTIVNSQFDQVYLFFTWSKANGALFYTLFYLKSTLLENASLGGSTTHVYFAYYTQAGADLPIKQR